MQPKNNSVFLVTANRLLRETLARVLSKKGGFHVCGTSSCIRDIGHDLEASAAEMLVLDSVIPSQPDGGLITHILLQFPRAKVVLIDMVDNLDVFLECARAGAMGYLLKDASSAEVLSAMRAVSHGQAVYPPHLCLPLFRAVPLQATVFASARMELELGLTRRQQQLVPLIARGLTNKEIASQLSLSEQTVKNHIHNMLRRVGASKRSEVISVTSQYRAGQ